LRHPKHKHPIFPAHFSLHLCKIANQAHRRAIGIMRPAASPGTPAVAAASAPRRSGGMRRRGLCGVFPKGARLRALCRPNSPQPGGFPARHAATWFRATPVWRFRAAEGRHLRLRPFRELRRGGRRLSFFGLGCRPHPLRGACPHCALAAAPAAHILAAPACPSFPPSPRPTAAECLCGPRFAPRASRFPPLAARFFARMPLARLFLGRARSIAMPGGRGAPLQKPPVFLPGSFGSMFPASRHWPRRSSPAARTFFRTRILPPPSQGEPAASQCSGGARRYFRSCLIFLFSSFGR
jgi:hypothetical protein